MSFTFGIDWRVVRLGRNFRPLKNSLSICLRIPQNLEHGLLVNSISSLRHERTVFQLTPSSSRSFHCGVFLAKSASNSHRNTGEKFRRESSSANGVHPGMELDLDNTELESSEPQTLIINKIRGGASDYWKLFNYLSALEKPRSMRSSIQNGLIGLSFEALKQNITNIVRDCGIPEAQAFDIAVGLRANKPPAHLKQTIAVLLRHSISLNRILNEQWETFLAILVIPPEQLEERILALEEAGLSGQEIEQLDATSLLLPLQDHIVERLRSLQRYEGGEAENLRSRCLRRLTPQDLTLQCPESSVQTYIALDKVLIELGITVSLSARIIDSASSANTLRTNLVYLSGPPLNLPDTTLGTLMSHHIVSNCLTQFDDRFLQHHARAIMELAELNFPEDPSQMLIQKIEAFPGLLNVTINMEMRKARIALLIRETRELEISRPKKEKKNAQTTRGSTDQGKRNSKKRPKTPEEQREEDIHSASLLFASNTVLYAVDEKLLILIWRILARDPRTTLKKILKGYVFTRSAKFYLNWLEKRKYVRRSKGRAPKSGPQPTSKLAGVEKFFERAVASATEKLQRPDPT